MTFDSLCRIYQDRADDFDWTHQSDKTPSGIEQVRKINETAYPVTGPSAAAQGKYYVFIEASKKDKLTFSR